MDSIAKTLRQMADPKTAAFTAKIIPNVDPKSILGIKTPELRALAKELLAGQKTAANAGKTKTRESGARPKSAALAPAAQKFLAGLPHKYFEENQLHGFVVSGIKDFGLCVAELERFLPFIDNWATCDQCSPACFKKNRAALLPLIKSWIKSERVYTVRFAIGMLMRHFLDEDFKSEYLEMVAAVKSGEYYIKMEVAWYFAEALAKQWDAALPYIKAKRLEAWTHNKAIQKARESFKVSDERKELLAGMKVAAPQS
ncbi:MAG: DNA alkylation repair protein [Treponema sp.]|nr:DNA alkylation repair protein [Treponema sp.]MEE3435411.1 DNA alkylation repair protein [Treponema sp.]